MSRPITIVSRNTFILSHIWRDREFLKTMNSTNGLRDYYIADEIIRISFLSKKELVQELIELKSKAIEQMSDDELLNNTRKV